MTAATEASGTLQSSFELGERLPRFDSREPLGRGPFMFYGGDWSDLIKYYEQDLVKSTFEGAEKFYICIAKNGPGTPDGVHFPDETDWWLPLGGGGGAAVRRAKIITALSDTLSCKNMETTTDEVTGNEFSVAKPQHLRVTPYSGQTIGEWSYAYTGNDRRTRTNTISGAQTAEEIYPTDYAAGEVIYIAQSTNKTELIGGVRLDWIDLNVIARHWLTVLTELDVCDNGVTKKILVRGGPIYTAG